MEFKQLGLNPKILEALKVANYSKATPIQEKAIGPILEGRDLIGLAQTGTGKTAAFALPMLHLFAKKNIQRKVVRGLIITPTRELAIQIQRNFENYGAKLRLKSAVIFGGVKQGAQVRTLRSGVDILVATPGRLIDLVEQKHVDLSSVEVFVLDEADRMLDMGFIQDIRRIISIVPEKKQTLLFSATMPKEVVRIVDTLLINPIRVEVTPVSSTVETVKQSVYFVDDNHKIDILSEHLKANPSSSVLVFTRTKHGADKVVKELVKRKVLAQAIHGNKSQNARQTALENFKNYKTQVLVATDIASRGIDIHELDYVINYDLPEVPETYVHRIGRTGRAGKSGTAISLCNYSDIDLLRDVEKLIKINIEELKNDEYPLVNKTKKVKSQRKNASTKRRERSDSKTSKSTDSRTKKPQQDKPSSYRGKNKSKKSTPSARTRNTRVK